jgi:type IV secretion system protein VirB5
MEESMKSNLAVPTRYRAIPPRVIMVATVFCAGATTHAQGVPTISPAELAQQMVMVRQLIQQVQNQEAEYQALTGNSSLGLISNNPALRNYLPEEWQDIYIQAKAGGLSGISSSMRIIEQQEGITGAATAGQQRYYDTLATNKAMNEQAYTAIVARFNNIQSLMQLSNMTQDPAQKADLQNRIAAEEAMVTNDQTRLQVTARLQENEIRLAQEQRDREFKNSFLGGPNDK